MGRLAVLLVLSAVAAAALASTQDSQWQNERDTLCWDCHRDDPDTPTPLASLWNVLPAPTVIPTDGPATLQLAVQNGWYHDVVYLEPLLDLTRAPSLVFHDPREPVEASLDDFITRPTPSTEPPQPPDVLPAVAGVTDPATGNVTFVVPTGATSLTIRMQTTDASFTPYVEWYIYPQRSSPEGDPMFGPIVSQGDTAVFTRDSMADFEGVGYGNWTVQARVPVTDGEGAPNAMGPSLQFHVEAIARFDAAQERIALQSRNLLLKPFETTLFSWDLRALGPPGPDEVLTIEVRGRPYWQHQANSDAIDEVDARKAIQVPLREEGGQPVIGAGDVQVAIITPDIPVSASLKTISEAVGYGATFLLLGSIASGGVFGKASRRGLNQVFGSAKRRVAFHNFLSYGLTAAALAHAYLFIQNALTGGAYHWTLGLIWGGLGILGMFGLGVTGALQVRLIRRWDYATWRWTHLVLAVATILFTLMHLLLDGAHFGAVQEAVGWRNPLDPRDTA